MLGNNLRISNTPALRGTVIPQKNTQQRQLSAENTKYQITTNFACYPSITACANGGFIVVWRYDNQSFPDISCHPISQRGRIMVQRYNAEGTAQGDPLQVSTEGFVTAPAIAELTGGNWVVGWAGSDNSHYPTFLSLQLYNAEGNKQGSTLQINGTLTSNNYYFVSQSPFITAHVDGGFFVRWLERYTYYNRASYSVAHQMQRFNASGHEIGVASRLSGCDKPYFTALMDGGYVAGCSFYMDRFYVNGNKTSIRIIPESSNCGYASSNDISRAVIDDPSHVVGLPDGGFALIWTRREYSIISTHTTDDDVLCGDISDVITCNHYQHDDTQYEEVFSGACTRIQPFSPNGTKQGSELILKAGDDSRFSIAPLVDNVGFVLTWAGYPRITQKFDSNWHANGTEIYEYERLYVPSIAALKGGGFIMIESKYDVVVAQPVVAQRFDASGIKTAFCQAHICPTVNPTRYPTPYPTRYPTWHPTSNPTLWTTAVPIINHDQFFDSTSKIIGIVSGCVAIMLMIFWCRTRYHANREIDTLVAPPLKKANIELSERTPSKEISQQQPVKSNSSEKDILSTPEPTLTPTASLTTQVNSLSTHGIFSNPSLTHNAQAPVIATNDDDELYWESNCIIS